jgi:predicted nuclease of predicted toxin-antitoxin system
VRIIVDENIPARTVAALRARDDSVLDIPQSSDSGADDDRVWEIAQEEGARLVTTDKGFTRRRTLPPRRALGAIPTLA